MGAKTPSKGREPYIVVSKARRESHALAVAASPPLNGTEWRVLTTVWELTSGYSKLTDDIYLAQLCDEANIRKADDTPDTKRVSKAIRSLLKKAPGVFEYRSGGGSRGVEGQIVSYPSRFTLPKARGSDQPQQGGLDGPQQGVQSHPPSVVGKPVEVNPMRVADDGYQEAAGKTREFIDALAAILNGRRRAGLPAEWNETSTVLRRRIARRIDTDRRSPVAIARWAGDQADLNKVRSIFAYVDRCLELSQENAA